MNSQRGPGSFRAKSLDEPKAKAQTKASANGKSKEQRDHHKTDRVDKSPERAEAKPASKRGSGKQQSKKEKDSHDRESEDKPNETPAPKRGTINRQGKKQRDPEISESKENGASVPDNANNAAENERQGSAQSKFQSKKSDCESEGKPQKTVKSKSDEKSAPKQKSTAKPGRQQESAIKTDFSDASPAVCQKKSAEQTATRGLKVDDTLDKVLKATLDKLKIKKNERSNASSCVNDITDKVIAHLERNTTWCGKIEMLRTGSYYENVKVSD